MMCSLKGNNGLMTATNVINDMDEVSKQVTCYGCLEGFTWTRECERCGSFFCSKCVNEHNCMIEEAL